MSLDSWFTIMDRYIPTGTAFMASASSEFLFPLQEKKERNNISQINILFRVVTSNNAIQ